MPTVADSHPRASRAVAVVLAGALALQLAPLILVSCGYFDPLDSGVHDSPRTVVIWQKTFGSSGEDAATAVQQTADGGFVLAGYTDASGSFDLWLIKTDKDGNLEWDRTFGGSADDRGFSVRQTPDGGYIVAGSTSSFGAGGEDFWLIKTDGGGGAQWSRTYGGSGSDRGRCVQRAADGGYVIVGSTDSFGALAWDVYLVKTDATGKEEWCTAFGESQAEGNSVRQTADGGYIVGGTNLEDAFLLKTDALGKKEWSARFEHDYPDYGMCAVQTRDGGYVLAGSTRSGASGDFDAFLVKTDASGNVEWGQSYGGGAWDEAECVRQTADGGYVLAGTSRSIGPWEQAWLIKTDASGTIQWNSVFGGDGHDRALSGLQTADGGYVVAGSTDSFGAGGLDAYLVRCDYVP